MARITGSSSALAVARLLLLVLQPAAVLRWAGVVEAPSAYDSASRHTVTRDRRVAGMRPAEICARIPFIG